MLSPRITAFKLKQSIWFIPKDTVFDFKDGHWHTQEPNDNRMQNETTLVQAIQEMVGWAKESEVDEEYIEVLKDYKVKPPKYISDFDGNKYKLMEEGK